MTLVDTNVLLDIVTRDPTWANWSLEQLEAAADRGPVLINDVVYAELSVRYSRIEELDAFVNGTGLELSPMTRPALFCAGKAFAKYRKDQVESAPSFTRFLHRRSGGSRPVADPHA